MPRATLSATFSGVCPCPRSAPSWAARDWRYPFAGDGGSTSIIWVMGSGRGACQSDYKRLFAGGARLTPAERVPAGGASGGGRMKRWAGVGIAGWAAAAAVLALGNGGVRGDDGEEQSRQVEIVRFAGGGARLGVVLEDVRAEDVARLKLAEERGAVVEEVVKGSAAEKAGLKEDDVILSYQGERVGSAAQLRRLVRETPGGRRVTIEASRAGAAQRLTATLANADDHELARGDDNFRFDMPDSFRFNVPVPPIPPVPPVP